MALNGDLKDETSIFIAREPTQDGDGPAPPVIRSHMK